LVIGGFKVKPDDPGEEFGIPIQDIILDKLKDLKFPVCFDFPVGHQPDNFALKAGIKHKLIVNNNSCTLEETI
jgi:muramoyltetrapeptide carboxypeptidase